MSRKNNKVTPFRFPFDIDTRYFLALAFLFFVISIQPVNEFIFSKLTIPKLKAKIEADVVQRLSVFNQLVTDTATIDHAFSQTLNSEQFEVLNRLTFSVHFFVNGELVCWNKIKTRIPVDTFKENEPTPYRDSSGYFVVIQKNFQYDGKRHSIVALLRIKNDYGIENTYFTRNYVAGDPENDFNLKLSEKEMPGSLPLIVNDKTQFFIYRDPGQLQINDKNGWRLFLSAAPFILFGVSIHTYYKVAINKKNILQIFSLLLLTVLLIRGATYWWGFPTDFREFSAFSAEYLWCDSLNKSLGDLFINMCLLFWILLYFIINVQGKLYDLEKNKFRSVFGIIILGISITACMYLSRLVYRITRDSVIPFDTTHFDQLNLLSFLGVLTFMVIFVNIVYVAIIARNYMLACFSNRYVKYILMIVIWLFVEILGVRMDNDVSNVPVLICIVALFIMQDLNYLKTKFDFNSYKLMIWLLFISAIGSLFLTLLLSKREVAERERFARKLLGRNETSLHDRLATKLLFMEQDTIIQKALSKGVLYRKGVVHYIQNAYFSEEENDFRIRINFPVDRVKNPHQVLSSRVGYGSLSLQAIGENMIYKMYPGITVSGIEDVVIEIELSRQSTDLVNEYADLLLSKNETDMATNDQYSYAFYSDSSLIERRGIQVFPYLLATDKPFKDTAHRLYRINPENSELWVRNQNGQNRVVVVKSANSLYLFTTLFAYIFFIYFVTVSLYILGNIIARSNLIYKRFLNLLSINLRLRIHFSILVVELCSFIIIGYFTSIFLIKKVDERMKNDLSKYSYSIQQEAKNSNWDAEMALQPSVPAVANVGLNIEMMKIIADRFSVNLNLYSVDGGNLLFSTMPELFRREVLSDRIDPAIFYQLKQGSFNNTIQQEKIGLLNFLSSYFLIRDASGAQIGIVQLPFFLSDSEIRSETTTIVTTLINIYIFVFLISAVIAFLLTKSVTRPFTYIVKQFTKINLSKTNEPLKWFDSDEIGLLIKEYNRMLRKLENSTVQLAKNEREIAWREMAKQVAHEIKNPLTPMKLSLQMLERAIKNNATNVNDIAIRVTKTLVEQIDNLSFIATNFSNFAKLPVSEREVFALNELLYSVTGMYHDDINHEFLFMIPDYEILLYADKSQIMRVFTNIIQNAIQSIPEDRKGNIALTISKVKNNHVRVSISDNGEGISDERSAKLFQPYFTTKTSGTGLGLAMCKDIIEESDGKITFESVIDEGTTFHVDLPIHMEAI